MKKILSLLVVTCLLISVVGCGGGSSQQSDADVPAGDDWKIGVITGTSSQNEEEFVAGRELVEKYGEDRVIHKTYPDNFTKEQETTITLALDMASDPSVKAIIFCQAVPGTAAAFESIREQRDDILLIAGLPQEDPTIMSEISDIVIDTDNLKRGETIMELAHQMGAKKFIHYSFPRHMSIELLAQRRDIFKQKAEELGIEFIEVAAPDPMGEGGIPASQQFILEDVPRQVAEHGKDTAFFSTNCAMQEPLIKKVLDEGAIFPEQCCPSPYHGYPGALGIEIPEDKIGDVDFIISEITNKVKEKGNSGRMATWTVPGAIAMIRACGDFAVEYAKGNVERQDIESFIEFLRQEAGDIKVQTYKSDNFLLFVGESQIF
ncbi:DUF3798 domain-containing protein [Tepidanaerobacter sp. GT38]|uniref:DUF3798 domain-containing protein n=1 Tax=Tepidanaerobacter sp. GT38 TaxID=2722793 RepID=UPI001F38867E|nr:DUF3798 domain-containing protein [Tepidanaerobacter sp. GT38]MCG1011049.1 DUF3798 domain-containing protein [Tepidanaerobacter sp. GT38]